MPKTFENITKILDKKDASTWVKSQMVRCVAYYSFNDYLYNVKQLEEGKEELVMHEASPMSDKQLLDIITKTERADEQAPEFLAVYHAAQVDYEVINDGFKYYHPEDPDNPKASKAAQNKGSAAERIAELLKAS